MRKFTGKMVAALLAGTLLFSSVPTVYGAEMDYGPGYTGTASILMAGRGCLG